MGARVALLVRQVLLAGKAKHGGFGKFFGQDEGGFKKNLKVASYSAAHAIVVENALHQYLLQLLRADARRLRSFQFSAQEQRKQVYSLWMSLVHTHAPAIFKLVKVGEDDSLRGVASAGDLVALAERRLAFSYKPSS